MDILQAACRSAATLGCSVEMSQMWEAVLVANGGPPNHPKFDYY